VKDHQCVEGPLSDEDHRYEDLMVHLGDRRYLASDDVLQEVEE
jgi:hypothetical protein